MKSFLNIFSNFTLTQHGHYLTFDKSRSLNVKIKSRMVCCTIVWLQQPQTVSVTLGRRRRSDSFFLTTLFGKFNTYMCYLQVLIKQKTPYSPTFCVQFCVCWMTRVQALPSIKCGDMTLHGRSFSIHFIIAKRVWTVEKTPLEWT